MKKFILIGSILATLAGAPQVSFAFTDTVSGTNSRAQIVSVVATTTIDAIYIDHVAVADPPAGYLHTYTQVSIWSVSSLIDTTAGTLVLNTGFYDENWTCASGYNTYYPPRDGSSHNATYSLVATSPVTLNTGYYRVQFHHWLTASTTSHCGNNDTRATTTYTGILDGYSGYGYQTMDISNNVSNNNGQLTVSFRTYSSPSVYTVKNIKPYSGSTIHDFTSAFSGEMTGTWSGFAQVYVKYGTSTSNLLYTDYGGYYGTTGTTWSVKKSHPLSNGTWYFQSTLYGHEREGLADIILATSTITSFIIDNSSANSVIAQGVLTSDTTPLVEPIDCSSSDTWFGYIYEGGCRALVYLFVPDTQKVMLYADYAKDKVTTSFPLGYITDLQTILATTTVGTLTVIDATLPSALGYGSGAHIYLDLVNVLDPFLYATTSQFINESATDERTLYAITYDYWEKIVYFLLVVYLLARIIGSGVIPTNWSQTHGKYAENVRARNRDVRYHNQMKFHKLRKR